MQNFTPVRPTNTRTWNVNWPVRFMIEIKCAKLRGLKLREHQFIFHQSLSTNHYLQETVLT